MIDVKPFIDILRRASKCKFTDVLMNNHMLIQCYDINIDSEVGLNYVLFIPSTESYSDPFYDETLYFSPNEILAIYNSGHKYTEEKRKTDGLKPKDMKEELCFTINNNVAELKFLYYLNDDLIITKVYTTSYPVDETSSYIENCCISYYNLISRIKPGGVGLVFDGVRYDLQRKVQECPNIYYFIVKYSGKTIRIPLTRSMFNGIKDVDSFYISLQESVLTDIFILSLQYTKKDITEQFWGYIVNF